MSRPALIAFGLLILLAGSGYFLSSVDRRADTSLPPLSEQSPYRAEPEELPPPVANTEFGQRKSYPNEFEAPAPPKWDAWYPTVPPQKVP